MKKNTSLVLMILVMAVFGTVGLVRRLIPLSSGLIAMCRGAVGALMLLLIRLCQKKRLSMPSGKKIVLLLFSGFFLGTNWILLFEAYRFTTVAIVTICYNMAPVFIMLLSPLLGERLTPKKILCSLLAVFGIVLVSGVLENRLSGLLGIGLSLLAALLYAAIVFINKRLTDVPAQDKTILQLGFSAVTLIPYVFLTDGFAPIGEVSSTAVLLLSLLCILHTGIAYWIYFSALPKIQAQTLSLITYIDPITACLLSVIVLHEPLTPLAALGILLVLGAIFCSEFKFQKKRDRKTRKKKVF